MLFYQGRYDILYRKWAECGAGNPDTVSEASAGENMSVTISGVEKHSPADKKGIKAGDSLISINGNEINDVLDYRFWLNDTKLVLSVRTAAGKVTSHTIKKDEFDDIGLEFDTYLMDKQHSCKNKCIFCFIDQLPKGLRDSLYFKDDDSRLSFLFGNYVTLTNLDDKETDRIINMHISPVNISVHTMNPELRVRMMANPRAGECLKYIKKFADAGIAINSQLVLCPGINDGEELRFSLSELFRYYPAMQSIACVPVGLTKYREGLCPLNTYTKETAAQTIDIIDGMNREFEREHGVKIAYASDEFYLLAEREMPSYDYYDDFPQLENGVGMWTLLKDEFKEALGKCDIKEKNRHVTVVTGSAATPLIQELAHTAMERIKGLDVRTVEVKNRFFGESITVSGLITGGDILSTLEGTDCGEEIIIPPNCLRSEGDMFLDNMTVDELSSALKVNVRRNGNSGAELLAAMIGEDSYGR